MVNQRLLHALRERVVTNAYVHHVTIRLHFLAFRLKPNVVGKELHVPCHAVELLQRAEVERVLLGVRLLGDARCDELRVFRQHIHRRG
ncbi:hypothetical protein SDC9_184051 [bioreactor metagenome]|uniref:Uncharacterized protein n=1 Tax=bioreactor metagenome TaxID=1076179 RepID=A0A645HDV3_9ZZZZ